MITTDQNRLINPISLLTLSKDHGFAGWRINFLVQGFIQVSS